MKWLRFTSLGLFLFLGFSGVAYAQYSSSNYKANEVIFGSGGDLNQSSANYEASVAAGILGVGLYSSANYQAYSGFLTPGDPFLELGIDTSSVDLGTLSPSSTNSGQASFHVRAYIDSGYTVEAVNQPPTYTSGTRSHTLAAKSTLGAPSVGIEEFGINLVHNTSPAVGSNPAPQPNGTFATGVAAPGYNTPDQFQYHPGDIVAKTPSGSSGWGLTQYTISYIADSSILTPAGVYQMDQDLVVVATY
jgi:hypothetical protein